MLPFSLYSFCSPYFGVVELLELLLFGYVSLKSRKDIVDLFRVDSVHLLKALSNYRPIIPEFCTKSQHVVRMDRVAFFSILCSFQKENPGSERREIWGF